MAFVHFLIGLFAVLLLHFESSLYILDISPLSDMWSANIFLPVCSLCFHPLNRVFCRVKVFNFDEAHLIDFFLLRIVLLLS